MVVYVLGCWSVGGLRTLGCSAVWLRLSGWFVLSCLVEAWYLVCADYMLCWMCLLSLGFIIGFVQRMGTRHTLVIPLGLVMLGLLTNGWVLINYV